MDTGTELMDAIINYLQVNSQVKTFFETSSFQECLIIIQAIIVIISAGCGVYKYIKVKNIKIHEKVLKEVGASI